MDGRRSGEADDRPASVGPRLFQLPLAPSTRPATVPRLFHHLPSKIASSRESAVVADTRLPLATGLSLGCPRLFGRPPSIDGPWENVLGVLRSSSLKMTAER